MISDLNAKRIYISPEAEFVFYDTEDTLNGSQTATTETDWNYGDLWDDGDGMNSDYNDNGSGDDLYDNNNGNPDSNNDHFDIEDINDLFN